MWFDLVDLVDVREVAIAPNAADDKAGRFLRLSQTGHAPARRAVVHRECSLAQR
jgi:hypothetical protein